jgi:predicted HTH domain antitoxin
MAEVLVTIPDRVADEWGREALPRIILEAFVLEAYRQERLTQGEVGSLLGLGFSDTEAFLRHHGAMLHYDVDDLEADRQAHEKLVSK